MERNSNKKTSKVKKRSLFYRISAWLHLWLGLFSGLVIVIVCITGLTWSFKDEIKDLLHPEFAIKEQNQQMMNPGKLYQLAKKEYPDNEPTFIWRPTGQAAMIGFGERNSGFVMFVHPYSGEIIKRPSFVKEFDFFEWTLKGHRFLWLPSEIGRPIINYSTLIFLITLITGLVLWWPKKWTKAIKKQSFTIKWKAKTKRLNYDLHNVFGFYTMLVLILISITGMYYGLPWFNKFLYWSTSLGKTDSKPEQLVSKIKEYKAGELSKMMEISWNDAVKNFQPKGYYYTVPKDSVTPISIFMYPSHRKFYDLKMVTYDRNTAELIENKAMYAQDYEKANFATKVRKLNYDLHVGSFMGGLFGRSIYFLITLIGASLPITGFLVWWFKKKK